jgi:hypothetical protein
MFWIPWTRSTDFDHPEYMRNWLGRRLVSWWGGLTRFRRIGFSAGLIACFLSFGYMDGITVKHPRILFMALLGAIAAGYTECQWGQRNRSLVLHVRRAKKGFTVFQYGIDRYEPPGAKRAPTASLLKASGKRLRAWPPRN